METACRILHNGGMVLDGVDVFVKVVQAGGFSAAARQLGMPTTTVSAKIARLEERLGVTLIQRSTRRMHVTAAGEAYFAHCVEALRALQAGEEQLAAASIDPTGMLRLTAPPDLAQSVLPAIVERYIKAYPKAGIELIVTNVPMDLLAEGIDLAVRASPMKDSTLTSRKFGAAPLGLFASQGYLDLNGTPQTVGDLAGHELLIHPRVPTGIFRLKSGETNLALPASARILADDMQTLRALARRGLGIAVLPDFSGTEAEDETLVRVLPELGTPVGTVYFVYPAQKFVPVNVRAFIDLALAEMKAGGG